MEVRNLNTFLRVACLMNFTKASQELGYSQSNVSAQIKQLEQEIGVPLFDRIGKKIVLTSHGEQLIPYAWQIVDAVTQIENFNKPEDQLEGTVRIGVSDSLCELMLEDALIHYHNRFPKVKIELEVDPTAVLRERLIHGSLDAGCLIDDPLSQTDWTIWDQVIVPVVMVANPEHPLAQMSTVDIRQIPEHQTILMEESAPYSRYFIKMIREKGVDFQPFLRLQSPMIASSLVKKNPYVSVLPLYSVQEAIQKGTLKQLHVTGWSHHQSVQFVLHKKKSLTPQIEGFLKELKMILGNTLSERIDKKE